MASWNPVHGAGELQALKQDLELSEATGRDLHTLLKWEKHEHKKVQQSHRTLKQEHLLLQEEYSSVTDRADANTEGTRELLFRLSNVEDDLPKFKMDLARYKGESRQLQDDNSSLRRELEQRRAKCEALSLQLKTTLDANELLRQALNEANNSLLETSKEVQLLKMQHAAPVSAHSPEPSKPAVLIPSSTLLPPASSNTSQVKRASLAGASPCTPERIPLVNVTNSEGLSRASGKVIGSMSSPAASLLSAGHPPHSAAMKPTPTLTPASTRRRQGRRIFLAGASPTTTTPKRIPMGNNRMYLAVGDIAHGCTLEGGGGGLHRSTRQAARLYPLTCTKQPLPTMQSASATPRSGRLFQCQEQHCIKGPSSSCSTRDSNSGTAAVSADKLTKTESSFQLTLTPLARTEPAGTASPSSAVLATAQQSGSPSSFADDDADLSGLMLLCAAADTISPVPSDAGGCAQLDKTTGLVLLCKAALGFPSPRGLTSPTASSYISSSTKTGGGPALTLTEAHANDVASSRRVSGGSLSTPSTGTRTAMSCSQSRRPSWSIARPQSHAATGGLMPSSFRGTRPAPTPAASSKLTVAARPRSPGFATDSQSDNPVHCVAITSDDDLGGLMLLCEAAETISPPHSNAGGSPHLDKAADLMLLCKAALGSPSLMRPSQTQLTVPEAAPGITTNTDGYPASTPNDTSGSQGPRPVHSTARGKASAVQRDRLRSRLAARSSSATTGLSSTAVAAPAACMLTRGQAARSPAATTGLTSTAVPAPAARMLTKGQAAAAARQAKSMPASSGAAASTVRKQARSLKPEAPTRRQPQRAAKPQWHC
ncbi:hypothetical protein ABBQ32_000401 [Trebouxia sp. C0010 RCD-2024]